MERRFRRGAKRKKMKAIGPSSRFDPFRLIVTHLVLHTGEAVVRKTKRLAFLPQKEFLKKVESSIRDSFLFKYVTSCS